jgi:hypothetical protein
MKGSWAWFATDGRARADPLPHLARATARRPLDPPGRADAQAGPVNAHPHRTASGRLST